MRKANFLLVVFFLLLVYCCNFKVTESNNLTAQQNLGHYLFFETQLSINNTKSCASCHSPQFAFTDGYRTSVTPQGENVLHNAPSLINNIFLKYYDWANTNATSLLAQIKRPLYSHQPTELGLDKHILELQKFFKKDSLYCRLFKQAFPNADTLFTLQQIEIAIVEYEKILISKENKFDKQELEPAVYNGLKLFTSKRLHCVTCHPPPNFTLATQTNNIDSIYVNIGLYNVNNKNKYPVNDNGIFYITKNIKDDGKFKIPSLRNVMLTAPYMHDGSIANINDVIDMYARGGRCITTGNNKGDGKLNTNKNKLITGFDITAKEKEDLLLFLNSLTDSSIFSKPIFQNPRK